MPGELVEIGSIEFTKDDLRNECRKISYRLQQEYFKKVKDFNGKIIDVEFTAKLIWKATFKDFLEGKIK